MKDKIVLIIGPTASGKSDIGVRIAQKINGEIISADSMQIYKGMDIGTAKITPSEMRRIPHYLINEVLPNKEFSVAMFKEKSFKSIYDILNRKKVPIIVGGTGLYINALVQPWTFTHGKPDETLRQRLECIGEHEGVEVLHDMLKEIDSISAQKIHPNNSRRVIRALEIYYNTGKSKSYWDNKSMEQDLPFEPLMIGLNMDRSALYKRIEDRVDLMIDEGLIEEVTTLLNEGYNENLVSMQGLGYKEIVKYIKGVYSYDKAIEILKRDTRHFAKRQLTWFRRDNRIEWYDVDRYDDREVLVSKMLSYLEDKGIYN